ncbi:MAG: hypothetical protein R2759_07015 [Bacteroidales bacterium]
MRKITRVFFTFSLVALIVTSTIGQMVDITFRVDMQEQTPSPLGVHIAGSFQGWVPSATLMTNTFADIWEYTTQLQAGTTIEYKFVNGDSWGSDESVYGDCGAGNGNRQLTIPATNTILESVCFGSCIVCNPPVVDVTFQVDMSNETVDPLGVFVQGSFQDPQWSGQQMTDMGNDIYAITVQIGEGTTHEYKFLNGTTYETVPPACGVGGFSNRSVTVPSTATTLPLVCFSSCEACVNATDISVTFRVDMSDQVVSPEGVHIAGGFQGWNPGSTLMTDMGNGIWEYTTILQSLSYHEYKFINGIIWDDAEIVPWYCNNNSTGNRFITVPESNIVLENVCFGSCLVCNPAPIDVTFSVDMSQVLISANGVNLIGSFQGWDLGNLVAMTDVGNDIYEATVTLGEGEFVEYKFLNGNTFDNAEVIEGGCANFSGNREFFVPSASGALDTDCFGQCGTCVATTYPVELKVYLEGPWNGTDMNKEVFANGDVPASQPFNTAPWNYGGSESFDLSPSEDIVDWVLIELRDAAGGPAFATPDRKVWRRAALLKTDGTIVRTDGTSFPQFTGYIQYDVYVVVYQRNHLSVLSANWIDLEESGTISYDFTTALSNAYGDGQQDLGSGVFGMIAGDSNADGTVDDLDKDVNWTNEAGGSGYLGSDLNMDGEVNNPDKVDYWEPNMGTGTAVPQ